MMAEKLIVIIAGPNGAGKTTFAEQYLPKEAGLSVFINADLIAAGLSPFDPDSQAVRAGKMMLREIAARVHVGDSFGFETTLSGVLYARLIPQWKAAGYRVHLVFLCLPSPDMAVARVASRVMNGGHNIPEATIRRRYESGRLNFNCLYKPLADKWFLYDNSNVVPVLIEEGCNP
jgi:predicted ABC-type ATPase